MVAVLIELVHIVVDLRDLLFAWLEIGPPLAGVIVVIHVGQGVVHAFDIRQCQLRLDQRLVLVVHSPLLLSQLFL